MNTDRRSFLTHMATLAGATAIAPVGLAQSAAGNNPAKPIRIGGIGLGPRGRQVLASFLQQPDVRFVAIADVQESRREIIRKTVNRHYGDEACTACVDMQEILKRPDIDAVIIATGDRWHGTASIMAARAGKDVYCEKPCTMTIAECQQLDAEFKKHQRIYQGGMQRRNVDNFQLAHEIASSGKLGKLHTLHAGIWLPKPVKPDLPGEAEPDAALIDWNRWLGPAPQRPYNKRYVEGQWRHFDGLSAGWGLHDWASHTVNLCQWVIGADGTTPVEYWPEDDKLYARYADGVKLVMRLAGFNKEGGWLGLGSCPVRFEGDKGWVEAGDFGKIATSDPAILEDRTVSPMAGIDPTKHVRNFLDAIKSRGATSCNASVVRTTEIACHAAAISWKLNRRLKFDPATESFVGDDEANALRSRARREPFTV